MKIIILLAFWTAPVASFATTGRPNTGFYRPTARPPALNVASVDSATASANAVKIPKCDEVCETTGITLKRFMSEVAMLNPDLVEMTTLFGAIETGAFVMHLVAMHMFHPVGKLNCIYYCISDFF
jgi:fructose-1,6-bisphosphatase I